MQWLTMTHAARWHAHRDSVGRGHLYQGRFRSFPIQQDGHFLSVCRYVERNALRANLVAKAQDWRWGSLWARDDRSSAIARFLAPWPVEMPGRWVTLVNRAESQEELAGLRRAVARGRPYGDDRWSQRTARVLGNRKLSAPYRPAEEIEVAEAGLMAERLMREIG